MPVFPFPEYVPAAQDVPYRLPRTTVNNPHQAIAIHIIVVNVFRSKPRYPDNANALLRNCRQQAITERMKVVRTWPEVHS